MALPIAALALRAIPMVFRGAGAMMKMGGGAMPNVRFEISGVKELQRDLRKIDKSLVKELGQVHRSIGEMVIARLGGPSTGVGSGAGETIRPSAASDRIQLRVGGSHRSGDPRRSQWGRVQKWPGGQPPQRPHLIGAANSISSQIEDEYLDGIAKIASRAGLEFRRG